MSRPRSGGLTKTQQLREAKSVTLLKEYERKEEKRPEIVSRYKARRSTYEPKKVDFSKPALTKAMLARMKQTEKFKQELEQKREEAAHGPKRPKRTAAPVGGDARLGRERAATPKTRVRSPAAPPAYRPVIQPPRVGGPGPGTGAIPRRTGIPTPGARTDRSINRRTNELARTMDADVVQAEAIGEGPIQNIVIPPGVVRDDRTTVINLQQRGGAIGRGAGAGAAGGAGASMLSSSQIANRSIQLISETLGEQEAVETAAVQNKLADLQQARRDFVIAVANVGGNAVNIGDEGEDHSHRTPAAPPPRVQHSPPFKRLVQVPDIEDEELQIQYGRDHPDVEAARRHMEELETDRRMEEEFQRLGAAGPEEDGLNLDIPFEEEFYEGDDISWEEDVETGARYPVASKVKAAMAPVPRKEGQHYQYDPFDPEELEKFFNLQRYPPCPSRVCQPAGKEGLHPDLWFMDDPWYKEAPQPDMPDLMQFDDDLIQFD